ncbi:hypothetical protein FHW36_102156 [Chitinophaga polysaccharea]|uniref:Tetratricopeptide repeat protein n=1 Tax=Chitinophaga polysaccharea TaxID=1293035 RepID=A0A561PWA8_9BACT|nr:hypothetical protein [Chitinophaga polysaccharea]TWF42401.1 hypothetical protein FHW36_102156 [Chitinophaga polysaccharea]
MKKLSCRQLCCIVALLAYTLLLSCKSGEKLYNKGRYSEAVLAFVKKLHRKPQDAAATRLLPDAYHQALQSGEDRVNEWLRSNNQLKWESVRNEYRALQNLYNSIHSSPAALKLVQPKDYRDAITGAQENAAEIRYDRGTELLNRGDKVSARQAYEEFGAALKLIPNYRDTKQRMDEAFQLGVVNVVVSQIEVRSPYYQFSADQFRDYLVRNLQQRNINRFVQFYDERIARSENLRPDEYIELRFFDFVVGQTFVDRIQRDVSKEIVTGTTKDTSGNTINLYQTVKATLYITKKTVVSKGLLDYRITDTNNGQVLRTDRIPGNYTWVNQFGTFRGDERALSDEDRKLMGGQDVPPPPPSDLFMEFTRPIYDVLARDLQSFYNSL